MSEVPLYPPPSPPNRRPIMPAAALQGYLAHKKHPPPRTLQYDYLGS